MRIYPAIDIKGGKAVRLLQGAADSVKEYGDPLEFALKWQEMGAEYLHVVDLDAAFTGEFVNKDIIHEIVHRVKIPVQTGGGIRTQEDVRVRIEEVGVSRVVIGTMAVEDQAFLAWARGKYGKSRIAVGIDAKDGKVLTRGWVKSTEKDAVELAEEVKKLGIETIIYTDVMRDGTLSGPNTEHIKALVKKTWMDVIASGGIKGIEDIKAVRDSGACGVIIGTALYEGTIDFNEAMKARK